MGFPLGLIRET